MSDGQVKRNTVQGYISLNGQRYFATGQVRNSKHLRIFYTPVERRDVLWNGPVCLSVRPSVHNCL